MVPVKVDTSIFTVTPANTMSNAYYTKYTED